MRWAPRRRRRRAERRGARRPPRADRRVGRLWRRSRERLAERAAPLIARPPAVPTHKALLSADGGVCPDDGAALEFDPWSRRPRTAVPAAAGRFAGERHDRAWARFRHLWLAERAADAGHAGRAGRARRRRGARGRRSSRPTPRPTSTIPTATTSSGPAGSSSPPISSPSGSPTTSAAALLLRESGRLDRTTSPRAWAVVAEEAANLIGEFDEGFSNRQTWHNAALAAIAVWFEDEELADARRRRRRRGILAHLMRGIRRRRDVVRGRELPPVRAARAARRHGLGAAGRGGSARGRAAGRPARRRAPGAGAHRAARRHLPRPQGLAVRRVAGAADVPRALGGRPRAPGRRAARISGAGSARCTPRPRRRRRHSTPTCTRPGSPHRRAADSRRPLLVGAARDGARAAGGRRRRGRRERCCSSARGSPSCATATATPASSAAGSAAGTAIPTDCTSPSTPTASIGSPDPGTGSYVAGDLFWYRSTLAHNAPRLDGRSQVPGDATVRRLRRPWGLELGTRTVRRDVANAGRRRVPAGRRRAGRGRGSHHRAPVAPGRSHRDGNARQTGPPSRGTSSFVERVERFTGRTEDGVVLRSHGENGATLTLHLRFDGTLLRASAPGRPGEPARGTMYLVRSTGRGAAHRGRAREHTWPPPTLRSLGTEGDVIEVETTAGVDRHVVAAGRMGDRRPRGDHEAGRSPARRGGPRAAHRPQPPGAGRRQGAACPGRARPRRPPRRVRRERAAGPRLRRSVPAERRALSRRRRSSPRPLLANWNEDALYLGVDVVKAEVIVRPDDAPPLRLDNEPDDIHADGIQVYLRPGAGRAGVRLPGRPVGRRGPRSRAAHVGQRRIARTW